jgi:hypothetical protein
MNAVVGTDLGTIAAAFISSTGVLNWRWNGWIAAIAFGVSLVLFFFFFEEPRYVRIPIEDRASASSSAIQSATHLPTEGEKGLAMGEKTSPPQSSGDVEAGQVVPALKTYREKLALWSLTPKAYRQSPSEVSKEILVLFTFPAVIWYVASPPCSQETTLLDGTCY